MDELFEQLDLTDIYNSLTDVGDTLPPPTGFHWKIPKDHEITPTQITLPDGTVITLNEEENREYHKILSWCQHYGRRYFRPDLYLTQKNVIAFFVKFRMITIELFRGAGKSWISEFILAYLICENPELRLFIVGEERSKTIDRVMFIRNIVTSPEIIRDYGYMIKQSNKRQKSQDRASSFTCIRKRESLEPTLMAISWQDQRMQGFHFDGGIFDDIWSIKLQNTIGAKEKFLKWYSSFKFTLEQCWFFIMLRTRKGVNDLYADLDGFHEYTKFTFKLVLEWPPSDSYKIEVDPLSDQYYVQILDEERFNQHLLYDPCIMEKDGKIFPKYTIEHCLIADFKDHEAFYREMQNQPFLQEGKLFKWDDIQLYDYESRHDNPLVRLFYEQQTAVNYVIMYDPASGTKGDYDVLGVWGYYQGKYWLQDARVGHWSAKERLAVFQEISELYPGAIIYVEEDFGQLSLFDDIKEQLPHLVIEGFQSRGKGSGKKMLYEGEKKSAKKGKIHDSLLFPISNKQVYVNRKIPMLFEPNGLRDQIVGFPDITYFDYLDMMAMGVLVLKEIRSQDPIIFAI